MPFRNGRLTHAELAFSKHYAVTGDVRYSAERAGYSSPVQGHKALYRPGVRDRIAALREARAERAATIGLNTLEEIAQDCDAGKMPRVSAADKLLKAAGMYQTSAADPLERDLHEMSAGELARVILDQALDPTIDDVEPEPAAAPDIFG